MNLLITGAWGQAREYISQIEWMGHRTVFMQQEAEALPCDPQWAEGVICNGLFLHHPMEEFTNLRYIQLTSAGYDRADMDAVRSRNIEIHNARGVYSVPMAEFALAQVLAIYKRLDQFRQQQKRHEWIKLRDLQELAGKRVVIVGCGSVGQACAQRFKAFDCEVVGIDLHPRQHYGFDQMIGIENLDVELGRADVVVVCVPLTKETEGLVKVSRIRSGGILVNISRGATVELDDSGKTAILDVFEQEPLGSDSPLWEAENVIVTPHNSFVGEGNAQRLSTVIINNLEERCQ